MGTRGRPFQMHRERQEKETGLKEAHTHTEAHRDTRPIENSC